MVRILTAEERLDTAIVDLRRAAQAHCNEVSLVGAERAARQFRLRVKAVRWNMIQEDADLQVIIDWTPRKGG